MKINPAENPPREVISDIEFDIFTDSKKTYPSTLYNIAEKISKNLPLSLRELAIQSANGTEIEKLLKEKKDSEPKIDTLEEKIKNMTQEDIKKLKEEQAQLLAEEEKGAAKISALEESIADKEGKITEIQNEGKENPTTKQTEINKRKEAIAKLLLEEATTEQGKKIEDSRKKYIGAYEVAVENVNPFKKMAYKLGNWIGANRKDAFTDNNELTAYNKQKNLKGDKTLDLFIDKRVNQREAEKKSKDADYVEKTPEQMKALKDRYRAKLQNNDTKEEKIAKIESALVDGISGSKDPTKQAEALKKLLEMSGGKEKVLGAFKDNKTNEAFSNRDFDFVKNENKTLRKEQKEAWEAKRNAGELMMVKAAEMIEKNKFVRRTIGNKWFRTAVISGGIGFATGGILSPVFWANRAMSVAGGMGGGWVGKLVGDKLINSEKILNKRQIDLDTAYKQGSILASTYDKERAHIDLILNRYARLKNALVLVVAGGGGMTGQVVDNHYHLSDTIGNKVDEAWDWTKDMVRDHLPRHEAGYGTEHMDTDSSTGNTVAGGNNPPGENAPRAAGTLPPKESIVQADSGKGVEHAFRAQIENDPALAAKLKDLYHYKGDISTIEGRHTFSGIAAHQMALNEGYVGADGSERWVHGTASYRIDVEPNGEVVIHEQVQNADGTWNQTETSNGQFETGVDKDPSGHVYESTHTAGHHGPVHPHSHTHTHVEDLKKSITEMYELPNQPIKTLESPRTGLQTYDLPPKQLPTYDLPPQPVQQHPTVPVQPTRPSFTPPGTQSDPMYRTGQGQVPKIKTVLENLLSKNNGGNELGQNIAMNSAPAGKDFLTILFEGFFGPETPTTPIVPPTPLETGGNGPMTA